MKETGESCSSNATGRPQALSSRKTLQVVALASAPLSGMTSCLAPSPAVMSSLETSVTRSGLPLRAWIFLVLPSVTSAPRASFDGRSLVLASKAAFLFLASVSKRNVQYITGGVPAKSKGAQNRPIHRRAQNPFRRGTGSLARRSPAVSGPAPKSGLRSVRSVTAGLSPAINILGVAEKGVNARQKSLPLAGRKAWLLGKTLKGSLGPLPQALRGLLGDGQVGVLLHVHRAPPEAGTARHVDVALQRGKVGQHVGVAVGVLAGEDPVEAFGRLLGHPRRDLHDLVVVLRVEIPVHDAQRILHEVDESGAVLVDERLARRPHDHLRHADGVALDEQGAGDLAQLWIERERQHAGKEVDLALRPHRAHRRKLGLDHGVVALVLEPELAQHCAGRDVDRAAGGVGGDHLALEVLDLFDRAVGKHHVFLRVVAFHAVAKLVG